MSLLLALLIAASTPGVREFRRTHPCPSWCALYKKGETKPYFKCGACDVDHKWPLSCGGPDIPSNMHYMDAKKNRAKHDNDCKKFIHPGGTK